MKTEKTEKPVLCTSITEGDIAMFKMMCAQCFDLGYKLQSTNEKLGSRLKDLGLMYSMAADIPVGDPISMKEFNMLRAGIKKAARGQWDKI